MRILVSAAGPVLLVFNMWTFDRPLKEDWKHTEILTFMTQHHDPTQPLLLASVLSHHPYFFARTLKWSAMQKGINMDTVSPGDSNASFAEFVIKRPGNQGTETGELDRQWQELHPATRAFTSLFSIGARFPLPDQSEAIAYERTSHPRFQVQPLNTKEVERRIAQALGQWVQGPLVVSVEALPAELAEGRLQQVRVSCSPCWIQRTRIEKAEVKLQKPWLNLYRLWDEHRPGLLAFESLKPTCEVLQGDLTTRLSLVKELRDARVELSGGKVHVYGRYKGIPVGATVSTTLDNTDYAHLDAVLERVTIAGVPLPGWILGKAHRQTLCLYPVPDFPGQIVVNQIIIDKGRLLIS